MNSLPLDQPSSSCSLEVNSCSKIHKKIYNIAKKINIAFTLASHLYRGVKEAEAAPLLLINLMEIIHTHWNCFLITKCSYKRGRKINDKEIPKKERRIESMEWTKKMMRKRWRENVKTERRTLWLRNRRWRVNEEAMHVLKNRERERKHKSAKE